MVAQMYFFYALTWDQTCWFPHNSSVTNRIAYVDTFSFYFFQEVHRNPPDSGQRSCVCCPELLHTYPIPHRTLQHTVCVPSYSRHLPTLLRCPNKCFSIPTEEGLFKALHHEVILWVLEHIVPHQDCLRLFSKEEKLTDNNRFYCSHCRARRDSLKKIEIWKLPPVLLVHLKR